MALQVAGAPNPETTLSAMHGQQLSSTGVAFWDSAVRGGAEARPDGFWGNRTSSDEERALLATDQCLCCDSVLVWLLLTVPIRWSR